jgi:hypothetical protein
VKRKPRVTSRAHVLPCHWFMSVGALERGQRHSRCRAQSSSRASPFCPAPVQVAEHPQPYATSWNFNLGASPSRAFSRLLAPYIPKPCHSGPETCTFPHPRPVVIYNSRPAERSFKPRIPCVLPPRLEINLKLEPRYLLPVF